MIWGMSMGSTTGTLEDWIRKTKEWKEDAKNTTDTMDMEPESHFFCLVTPLTSNFSISHSTVMCTDCIVYYWTLGHLQTWACRHGIAGGVGVQVF